MLGGACSHGIFQFDRNQALISLDRLVVPFPRFRPLIFCLTVMQSVPESVNNIDRRLENFVLMAHRQAIYRHDTAGKVVRNLDSARHRLPLPKRWPR